MDTTVPNLDTPAVHPTYLRLMLTMLRAAGVDIHPLMRELGLGSPEEMAVRTEFFAFRVVNRLLSAALRASGRPWLGLELGLAAQAAMHGPVGYAIVSSRDLMDALRTVERFGHLRNVALRFRLRTTPSGVALEVIDKFDLEGSGQFVHLVVFATLLRLLEVVIGSPLHDVRVGLPFPEPAWGIRIRQACAGEVRFDAERLVFDIDAALLHLPCVSADQAAHEFACRDCERLAAATRQGTLAQKVLEQLGAIEGEYPTLESMARTLSVSGRTLIRRLKAEGTSYQRLLDDVRLEKAQWYLLNTRYPIEEIAARVGFVKTANFSRTFKRWHGMTPSQARSMAPHPEPVAPAPRP